MRHAKELVRAMTPTLRRPDAEDGAEIWELVRACKPLDENSMYCNLIQCDHFRDTCIVAEHHDEIVGWISAYIRPDDPETLFVWQVAVGEQKRGTGLGLKMLKRLLARDACHSVRRIQTTITRDNRPSWTLFRKFARHIDAGLRSDAYFTKAEHFRDRHGTEHMVTIDLDQRPGVAT